jgi:hypothetical protein
VVLPLLTECVRKAGETARAHTNAEVLAFNDGCADAVRIGLSYDWDYLQAARCYQGHAII